MSKTEAGRMLGLLKQSRIDRVIAGTRAMPRAVVGSTDSRLL
jgi:hypothetical protein